MSEWFEGKTMRRWMYACCSKSDACLCNTVTVVWWSRKRKRKESGLDGCWKSLV